MAWDGSGQFTRTNGTQTGATTWAAADAAGNDITTGQHDTHDEDLADGIQACVTKDGQSKPTADFKPNADAQYSLGSAALKWVNLFLSGVINSAQGADIASATTTNLDTATGNVVDVTGTTTITGITLSQGRWRLVRFTGALTLTHGSSLVLPGAANITTAAGDWAIFVGGASSVVRCVKYTVAALSPNGATAATQAEMEAASSTTAMVTPGRQKFHPGMLKAWGKVTYSAGTPSVGVNYNCASVTDTGVGDAKVNLTVAFSAVNVGVGLANPVGFAGANTIDMQEAGVVRVISKNTSFADADQDFFFMAAGDQA